jgi:hypothetical protein
MQVQIRNPIAVEVDAADDKGSVSFHFFTAAEHQAVVTIGRDLLPDLIEQLEEIIAAEAKPKAAANKAAVNAAAAKQLEAEATEPAPAPAAPRPIMQKPAAKPLMQKTAAQPVPAQPDKVLPARQPSSRDFALFERDTLFAKPKEPARDHPPAHQPILRALLQA